MIEDYEKKQQEKQEMQEAGANTAHVAGKAAATYFGGKVGNIAYDKISQTRAGQAIEKRAGKIISKVPVVNKLNKKLNDTGVVGAADQAVDAVGGLGNLKKTPVPQSLKKGPQNKKSSNLKSSSGGNDKTPQALKNKNHSQGLKNRFLGSNTTTKSKSESEPESENYDEEETSEKSISNLLGSKRKYAILMKILPVVLPIAIGVFFLLIIIVFIGNTLSTFSPFFSLSSHKSDDPEYVYTKDQEKQLQAEIDYNSAIVGSSDGSKKGIVQEYQEKYGVTIDWYLLEATLEYKYTIDNDENMHTDDGVTEEELNEKLEELDDGAEADSSSTSTIDYSAAKKKIKTVAALMITKNSDGTYSTDNQKEGKFYNALIDSRFLKSYYKSFLANNEYETRKALVEEIFDYAEQARELLEEDSSSTFLSDQFMIYLQTCKTPYTYKKNERGKNVFNNPGVNKGTSYPEYLNMSDYLKGVVMAELGTESMKQETREGVKALVVAATTYMLGSFGVDFYPGVTSIGFPSGDCRQLTCDPNFGCSYDHSSKFSTTFTGLDRNVQKPGWKKPLTATQQKFMDGVLSEVFGDVMVKKGITSSTISSGDDLTVASHYDSKDNSNCGNRCLGQKDALQDSRNGMTYTQILDKYYNSNLFDIINIKEGLYFESENSYNGTIQLNEKYHYHQSDSEWKNEKLCGSGAMSAYGCNITSAASAISLLKNQRITPLTLNNRQNQIKTCNPSSRPDMISDFAKLYGLNTKFVARDDKDGINQMLAQLASGNTVIVARLGSNNGRYKTSAGHYITLVGVKTENGRQKVFVWDTFSSKNRDSVWADFNNDIAKYTNTSGGKSFIVISRGG